VEGDILLMPHEKIFMAERANLKAIDSTGHGIGYSIGSSIGYSMG
jgi:hypothetical protein